MQALDYNELARKKIEMLYFSIDVDEVFGVAKVKEVLNCSDSTARAILAQMRDEVKIITPVRGRGKAKYRFVAKRHNS